MKRPWFHIVCELDGGEVPAPTVRDIQAAVCDYYVDEFTINDLISARRGDGVEVPRHVAMYLSRALTLKSFPTIGRAFNRDHTTVCSAVRKISGQLKSDPFLALSVSAIASRLGERIAA